MDGDPVDLTNEQFNLHQLNISTQNAKAIYSPRPDAEMCSPFTPDDTKSTYYGVRPELLESTVGNGEFIYKVNNAHHLLHYITASQNWPKLVSRTNEIQICWTHNKGTSTYDRILMKINNDDGPSLNNVTSDCSRHVYIDKNLELDQNLMGNNDYEEEWAIALPASKTNPKIYFSFSRGRPHSALGIFRYKKEDSIRFVVTPRREISKLLRMRKQTGVDPELKNRSGPS